MAFEEVEHGVPDDGEVECGVVFARPVGIFAERDVEPPVEFVFDAPVGADSGEQRRSIGRQ